MNDFYPTVSVRRLQYRMQSLSRCGIRESSKLLLPVLDFTKQFADPHTASGAVLYDLIAIIQNVHKLPSPFLQQASRDWRERLPQDPDRYGCMKSLATGGAMDLADFHTVGEVVAAVLEEGLQAAIGDPDGIASRQAGHYIDVLQALKGCSDGIVSSIQVRNDRNWMMGWLKKMNGQAAAPILFSITKNQWLFDDRMLDYIQNLDIPGVDVSGVSVRHAEAV